VPEFTTTLNGLAEYLAAQPGLGALGSLIYMGWMPDQPDRAVALYEAGGGPNQLVRDGFDPGVESPTVACIVRDVNYPAARSLAQSLYLALVGMDNVQTSDSFWLYCQPLHPPIYAGRDTKTRVTFNINCAGERTPQ
jgi:hypothetical protein